MRKAILLSIRPQWVAKILNGEKTIEVRKQFPKDYVGWVYIYCTKDKKHLVAPFHFVEGWKYKEYNDHTNYANGCTANIGEDINGTVIARFWCDKVEEIEYKGICYRVGDLANTNEVARMSCLDFYDLKNYLGTKNGYAIHISILEVFGKPRVLNGFYYFRKPPKDVPQDMRQIITKAPQNYCYIGMDRYE